MSNLFQHEVLVLVSFGLYCAMLGTVVYYSADTHERYAENKATRAEIELLKKQLQELSDTVAKNHTYVNERLTSTRHEMSMVSGTVGHHSDKLRSIQVAVDDVRVQILGLQNTTTAACNTASLLLSVSEQVSALHDKVARLEQSE